MNNIIFTAFQHGWTNLFEQGVCRGDKPRCKGLVPYRSPLQFCLCICSRRPDCTSQPSAERWWPRLPQNKRRLAFMLLCFCFLFFSHMHVFFTLMFFCVFQLDHWQRFAISSQCMHRKCWTKMTNIWFYISRPCTLLLAVVPRLYWVDRYWVTNFLLQHVVLWVLLLTRVLSVRGTWAAVLLSGLISNYSNLPATWD